MKKVIDYKLVEMSEEEWDYYNKLIIEFSDVNYSGAEQFRDLFDVDEDGCISMIRPPMKKQVAWAIILFLQNLMINQRLRRMEKWVKDDNS